MNWNDIDKNKLIKLYIDKGLSDAEIANIYDVSKSQVRYKRKKHGITYDSKVTYNFLNSKTEARKRLDTESFNLLNNPEAVDLYAKSLINYLFRSGPVEDMHCAGQLSQEDMKILNKYIVNRAATLLELMFRGEWFRIYAAFEFHKKFGQEWDSAEYDFEGFEMEAKMMVNNRIPSR